MKTIILILALAPVFIFAQEPQNKSSELSFHTFQYICTTGADKVYTGDFVVSLSDSLFTVTNHGEVVLMKIMEGRDGSKSCFTGGYIKAVTDLNGDVYGFWVCHLACNKTYFYRRNWGTKKKIK